MLIGPSPRAWIPSPTPNESTGPEGLFKYLRELDKIFSIMIANIVTNTIGILGILGISSTGTAANNLRGTVTFAAANTATVTFVTPEFDTSYFIVLGANANKTFWWSAKTVTGFTVNASGTSSDTVDWVLIR